MKLVPGFDSLNWLKIIVYLIFFGDILMSSWTGTDAIKLHKRRTTYNKKSLKDTKSMPSRLIEKFECEGDACSNLDRTTIPPIFDLETILPLENLELTTEIITTTDNSNIFPILDYTRSIVTPVIFNSTFPSVTVSSRREGQIHFEDLNEILRLKKLECKKWLSESFKIHNFTCEKLKLASWLMNELESNSTDLVSSFVKLVKTSSNSMPTQLLDNSLQNSVNLDETQLLPETGPERLIYKLIMTFGEPVDRLLFYQFKKLTKSRDLQINLPNLVQLQFSSRTHSDIGTGRTLFDPGFNLKLKFPFFQDELKVAVSTGPSFLAGLGVGLVVLGIKSIFAPFIFAMKAMMLSWFFKDLNAVDFVKTIATPMLPSWLTGFPPGPPPNYGGWEQSIENSYEPPPVSNQWSYGPNPKGKGLMGAIAHLLPFGSSTNQLPKYPNHRPIPNSQSLRSQSNPSHYYGSSVQSNSEDYNSQPEENQNEYYEPPRNNYLGHTEVTSGSGPSEFKNEGKESDEGYKLSLPSETQHVDVTDYDPFYSPLLSRIDSIFSHLGFSDEGCKERAVCSIYKYPVKYAPYSNLLSAQLSKRQNELKRPVNTSPTILRYFKYMKAAKDGQAALNCPELYPTCNNDTEKLTNLPMVKTFQQLTELMGPTGLSESG